MAVVLAKKVLLQICVLDPIVVTMQTISFCDMAHLQYGFDYTLWP